MKLPSFIRRAHLAFIHDLIMAALALPLTMYLRIGGDAWAARYHEVIAQGTWVLVLLSAAVFLMIRLYRGVWRYASMPDLMMIARAVTIVVLLYVPIMFVMGHAPDMPRSAPAILWLVMSILLGAPRYAYRVLKDRGYLHQIVGGQYDRTTLLIYGTGERAELFLRAIQADKNSPYMVVGFLDDKNQRHGRTIRGVPILGGINDLAAVCQKLSKDSLAPQRLVVAQGLSRDDGSELRAMVKLAEENGLVLSQLPNATALKNTGIDSALTLQPISVEDLLGRPQAHLDLAALRELIAGQRVLITGAGGSIGSELVRQVLSYAPSEIALLDNSEYNLYKIDQEVRTIAPATPRRTILANVRDAARVQEIFHAFQPEIVFHAAALKHVNLMESHLAEAILTNAIGTRHVADAARAIGTRAMVMISTDKAIRPTSVMGASKRLAEIYCQALDILPAENKTRTRFVTVRFGNVLGSSGSVVPLFQEQLSRGGPITVTDPEMRRYFMTIAEAVALVLQSSAYALAHDEERGQIFVLDMGEPMKIVDLARQMIRLAGLRPDEDIKIEFIGMQPGEKLFEELLDPDENPTKTAADRIYRATPVRIDAAQVQAAFDQLLITSQQNNPTAILRAMQSLLPGFKADDLQNVA